MPNIEGPGRLEWEPTTDGEKLRAIFDTVSVGIILVDETGSILHANARTAEMFGWPLDELLGMSYTNLTAPDLSDSARENIALMASGAKNLISVERLYLRKDGTTFWGHLSGRRLVRPDDTFWALVGVITDISARKAAEKALSESEARVRTVLEELPQLAISLDSEGKVLFANKHFLATVGMERWQVVGHDWFELFIPEEERTKIYHDFRLIMDGKWEEGEKIYENDIMMKGERRRVVWSSVLSRDRTGRPIDTTALGVDVTERRQALKALEENERRLAETLERLRYHVENSPLAVIEWDGSGRMMSWSLGAERMFGWTEAEVLGKTWEDWRFVHEEELETVNGMVEELKTGDLRHTVIENRNYTRDGSIIHCQWFNSLMLDKAGRPVSILSQVQDVTGRVKARQALRASLAEKDVLLQEIHHRVKNNMQVISSLLNLQARGLDDPGAREALKEARQRVQAMAVVHEKIYSSGNLSSIDMAEYLNTVSQDLVHTYRLDGRVGVSIRAGKLRLAINQVIPCGLLVNELLTNALKHAFPGGRGGRVEVRAFTRQGLVHLVVSDNGVGFAEGVDFRNLKGLGLQLVLNLASQLKGDVDLRPGDPGSEFELRFPLVEIAE